MSEPQTPQAETLILMSPAFISGTGTVLTVISFGPVSTAAFIMTAILFLIKEVVENRSFGGQFMV